MARLRPLQQTDGVLVPFSMPPVHLRFGVVARRSGAPGRQSLGWALPGPGDGPRNTAPKAGLPVSNSSAAVEQRARLAAERVLKALRDGDAQARYDQFAPELQRMTSPYLVAMNMRKQPKVRSWVITSVIPGVDSSTVEAELQTSAGERMLLMVIDENGLLAGYHIDMADLPAEKVVADFVGGPDRRPLRGGIQLPLPGTAGGDSPQAACSANGSCCSGAQATSSKCAASPARKARSDMKLVLVEHPVHPHHRQLVCDPRQQQPDCRCRFPHRSQDRHATGPALRGPEGGEARPP